MIKIITISSACLALTLTACSKEQTAELVQSDANNATEQSQTLRIAAAANLSDVLPEIIAGYKMDKNLPAQAIDVTYASSGKLYAQITSGAPYDIFLSANQEFPAKLAKEKLDNAKSADEATHEPFTYTQGQLALYSVNKSLKGLNTTTLNALLMSESDSKITIANPELAPYGKSAQAYLQSQNIGQAFQYAHTGNVDYGFVAQSQLTAIKATPEQFYTLAPESYPPILQDGLVISETAAATDFSNYLRSPAGQQYFSDAGYLAIE